MWTRNYYNLLTASLLGDTTATSASAPSDYNPPIRIRLPNGNYATAACENGGGEANYMSRKIEYLMNPGKAPLSLIYSEPYDYAALGCYIAFGSGSTPAAYDDYKMSSIANVGSLASVNGVLQQASAYNSETHKYSSKRSFTVTNGSATPKTVTEFGIYLPGSYYNTNYNYFCMVYHESFEAITLEQGESIIITFDRNANVFNYTPY